MGCCVIVIALISQLFALRRKMRVALGLPVQEWYDEGPGRSPAEVWRERFQAVTSSSAGRSILATLVLAELTFVAVSLPGPNGLVAEHRQHIRQVVEFFSNYGQLPDSLALMCTLDPGTRITSSPGRR
jgi:hypothetical protein